MKFTKLLAYPIWPETINIIWDLDNTQMDGDYKFQIFNFYDRYSISGPLYNKYFYRINFVPMLDTETRNAYKFIIQAEPPIIDEKRNLVPVEATVDLYHGLDEEEVFTALEIIRKENLRFEKKIGLQVKVLKRKTYGTTCTACLDPITKAITNSQCPVCFGTRYIGGYYNPESLWAEIVENPVIKQVTDVSTMEEKVSQIRLTNEVMVSKKDVIVDVTNNNRWVVSSEPSCVKYRSYPIGQQFTAYMASPKSVIYKKDV